MAGNGLTKKVYHIKFLKEKANVVVVPILLSPWIYPSHNLSISRKALHEQQDYPNTQPSLTCRPISSSSSMDGNSLERLCNKCRRRSTKPTDYCEPCIIILDQEIKDHWLPVIDGANVQLKALKKEQKVTESSHEKMKHHLRARQKSLEAKKLVGGDEYRKLLIELSERDSIYKHIKEELDGRIHDLQKLLEKDRNRFADEFLRFGEDTGRKHDAATVRALIASF